MNQNARLALAASAGIAVGAGGTWFVVSNASSNATAIAKADIVAAIKADPTLCPVPDEPAASAKLDVPNQAEALLAVRKLEEKNPSAQAIARTVGFAKDQASGEWIATDRK